MSWMIEGSLVKIVSLLFKGPDSGGQIISLRKNDTCMSVLRQFVITTHFVIPYAFFNKSCSIL